MVRAIFLSNLLYLVLTVVNGAAVGVLYAVTAAILSAGAGHPTALSLTGSSTFGYLVLVAVVFAEITAGAAAGWMAKENMLIAGLFSNLLPFLGAMLRSWALSYLAAHNHPTYDLMRMLPSIAPYVTGYAAPVFGLVGGIIAACASFPVVFRWLLMLVVGTFIYAMIFAIGVRSGLGFLAIVAATLAVVAGVAIAPAKHRPQAFIVLVFFAIFVPVGILAWQLQGQAGSTMANLLWAVFNAAGCAIAFFWVRRHLHAGYGESLTG